jgi:molybdopterin converting factor small subunit
MIEGAIRMVEAKKSILVRVKLLGFLEAYSERSTFIQEADAGSTIEDMIAALVNRFGEDFRRALLDNRGLLNGGIELFVGGELVSPYQLSTNTLLEDTELIFVPMIAGGSSKFSTRFIS